MKTLFTSIITIAGFILLIIGACISKNVLGENVSQCKPLLKLIGGIASASLCGIGLAICAISKTLPKQIGVLMIVIGCFGILTLVLLIPGDIRMNCMIAVALILVMLGWLAVSSAMFTFSSRSLNEKKKTDEGTETEQ